MMNISISTTEIKSSLCKYCCFFPNAIFVLLLISPLSSWGVACDLSVSSEEGLRSALMSCEGQDGGTIYLDGDISATKGEFSYIGYGGGNLKIDGKGHSISVPKGSEWRILNFGSFGRLTIENLTLANGIARGSGGAINVPHGSITVKDSTLTGNRVIQNQDYQCAGGAIYASGPITVVGSRIIGNEAGGDNSIDCGGGGIFGDDSVTITDSTLSGNNAGNLNNSTAGYGGGANSRGPLLVVDSIIIDNTANAGGGGGLFGQSNVTITSSTIQNNKVFGDWSGGQGGAVYGISNGTHKLLVAESTISGNESASDGGGIGWIGPIEIDRSTVKDNISARSNGGGIYSLNTLTIAESLVTGNKAEANGGGIYSWGAIHINKSTINDNSAKIRGGGTYIWFPDLDFSKNYNSQINNSTITKNKAKDGGGIATAGDVPGKINMNFTTVSSNHSIAGAANLSSSSTVLLKGSVITDPLGSRRNCTKAVTASSSYSVEGSKINSCGLNRGQGNKIAPISAIALGALGDNGGPTPTMLPSSSSILFTSAAPDGLGSGIIEDQRRFTRKGSFTIGSVQLLPHEITPYSFEGFFKPISSTNWNNIKLKSIIPVSWRLSDTATGKLLTDPASVISRTYTRLECPSGTDFPDSSKIQANGSAVVWKKASKRFEFKWKTPLTAGECLRLDLRFSDNQTHSAKFFIMKPQ